MGFVFFFFLLLRFLFCGGFFYNAFIKLRKHFMTKKLVIITNEAQ